MRELELFAQYLVRLRQEKLQQSHATLLGDLNDNAIRQARTFAFEAELCSRIHGALKELEKDPGEFIKTHLQRERA